MLLDTPVKAFTRLKTLFEGSNTFDKAQAPIAHLKDVMSYAKRLGVHNKIYINPLSSFREDFFQGGILFQCVYDKKFRDVFAAGGRYDSLIREHRPKLGNNNEQRHAVGFSLSWEKLARIPKAAGSSKSFMKKAEAEAHGIFNAKRVSPYNCLASSCWLLTRNSARLLLQASTLPSYVAPVWNWWAP